MSDATPRTDPPQIPPPVKSVCDKEELKLDLEIESLRKKNRWEFAAQIMPIIATLVGVAGFFLTIFIFQIQRAVEQDKDLRSREVDQRTRFQNQMRTDIDEILGFTREEKLTLSRVLFLLEDVNTVMESKLNETQKVADVFPGYKRSLSESLMVLIRDDCDFSRHPRDVGLANTVIEHWGDYSEYLKSEIPKLDYILYEYTRAMQTVRDQNPGYLEGLRLEDGGYEINDKYRKKPNERQLYSHFVDIVDGFKSHIALLESSNADVVKVRKERLKEFELALCNPVISKDILGSEFTDAGCKGR